MAVGDAAVVEGDGVIRVELDRLVEILDGALVLALVPVGVASIGEGGREALCALLGRLDDRRARADDEVLAGPGPELAMLVVEPARVPLLVPILRRCRTRQQQGDNRQNGPPNRSYVLLQQTCPG